MNGWSTAACDCGLTPKASTTPEGAQVAGIALVRGQDVEEVLQTSCSTVFIIINFNYCIYWKKQYVYFLIHLA